MLRASPACCAWRALAVRSSPGCATSSPARPHTARTCSQHIMSSSLHGSLKAVSCFDEPTATAQVCPMHGTPSKGSTSRAAEQSSCTRHCHTALHACCVHLPTHQQSSLHIAATALKFSMQRCRVAWCTHRMGVSTCSSFSKSNRCSFQGTPPPCGSGNRRVCTKLGSCTGHAP